METMVTTASTMVHHVAAAAMFFARHICRQVYVFAVLFAQAVYDHINDPDAGRSSDCRSVVVATPLRQGLSLRNVDLR